MKLNTLHYTKLHYNKYNTIQYNKIPLFVASREQRKIIILKFIETTTIFKICNLLTLYYFMKSQLIQNYPRTYNYQWKLKAGRI